MNYISTRGGVEPIGFTDAVFMGLATDGGLLMPNEIPIISPKTCQAWSRLSFQELAFELMIHFIGNDISYNDLRILIERSYATFTNPEITPLIKINNLNILELFHGPTAAFKDVALQFLGNLFDYFLERNNSKLTILGATSGDTGSAAIAGVRGKERIQIFILYPKNRVSPLQERQMITVLDNNVHAFAIRGTFDDAQRIVKELFSDLSFKVNYKLGAINSINWARILAQTVYYFYAWGRFTKGDFQQPIKFAVPTGNFGDIFAGYLAKKMGLPIEKLIIATNRNDILTRLVQTGIYKSRSEVYCTLSPAMDIQLASNFERYLYLLYSNNSELTRKSFDELQKTGSLIINPDLHQLIKTEFNAVAVNDQETLAQINTTFQQSGYLLCPHTAVGVRAARDESNCICLATAHPAKFNEAINAAIGKEAALPVRLNELLKQEIKYLEIDATVNAIREQIKNFKIT